MDTDRAVVVSRDDMSPLEAKIMTTYFINRCNDIERYNMNFTSASGDYNEETGQMTVRAELTPSTSEMVGKEAVERAFQFAADMLAN